MNRRHFLAASVGAAAGALIPASGAAAADHEPRALLLIALKGGNDALNTLVPFRDPLYARLRPTLALPADGLLHLDPARALHPALQPLMAIWQLGELALVDGVGYPTPSLSHFRATDIWESGSGTREYLGTGWLGRAFTASPAPASHAADGVAVGNDLGPLAAPGARSLVMQAPDQLRRHAAPVGSRVPPGASPALEHVLRVQRTLTAAAARLDLGPPPQGELPPGRFGRDLGTALRLLTGNAGVTAVTVSLDGFDTHARQDARHERLLRQLATGLATARQALQRAGLWRRTLVLTYSEFGRRPAENDSGGTDHGTAGVQLMLGGAVRGGLYGSAPSLRHLDGNDNLIHSVDYRRVYATVLERWWGIPSLEVLGGRFATLPLIG
jgi:uncharacterized protein (DUF1501 family)